MLKSDITRGERLQELFLAAVEIVDPQERARFLRGQCGHDSALLGEVESLVAADCPQGSFLEQPAFAALVSNAAADRETPLPAFTPNLGALQQGHEPNATAGEGPFPCVAGYEILGILGRGGMGVVYRAHHLALKRVVALKMIVAGPHAGPDQRARFRTEAEAVARLQHQNIVQVFETGEHGGLPHLSLEYVDGGSLAGKLAGTPQNPRAAAELIHTLAQAMHHAHQTGIIHRDLKPANILLTNDGTPKITDFGLAKQLDSMAGQTHSGAIMGTPSYMAPEQAGGIKTQVGPATDIYALGAILYEMLTGRPPFRAETPTETLLQVSKEEPVRPRILAPRTPRDLETICLKCLRREPAKRYATAGDLAEDLDRFLHGEPIRARPVGRVERALQWACRKPAAAALIVVLTLASLGGVAGLMWFQQNESRLKAQTLRDRLLEATIENVPAIVNELPPYRRWADALLRESYTQAEANSDAPRQLRASLALLPVDPGQVDYLCGQMLQAQPQEFVVIRNALREHGEHKENLSARFWAVFDDLNNDREQRFRAACALAAFAPQDARWPKVSPDVAAMLERQNPLFLPTWIDVLQPINAVLLPSLASFLKDEERSGAERRVITTVFAHYAAGQPEALQHLGDIDFAKPSPQGNVESEEIKKFVGTLKDNDRLDPVLRKPHHVHEVTLAAGSDYRIDLVSKEIDACLRLEDSDGKVLREDADSGGDLNAQVGFRPTKDDVYRIVVSTFQRSGVYSLTVSKQPKREPRIRDAVQVRRQAQVAAALLALGREEKVWPLLKHQTDPSLRSFLIEDLGSAGPEARILTARLEREPDVSARRAILLALGGYGLGRLSRAERDNLVPMLSVLYLDDPDPGIHGAAEWLLRTWGHHGKIQAIDKLLMTGKVEGKRQWHLNRQGQTMVVFPKPAESFWMGQIVELHKQAIARSFAISAKEVTAAQFLAFRKDHKHNPKPLDRPAYFVTWYDAAAYCNWLSEKEGFSKDQWCYLPNQDGEYAEGMKIAPDWRQRSGYRLPTEAEWEFSCRAGADTDWSFGQYPELLGKYGWFAGNALYVGGALGSTHSVGTLKPNDFGLFDMHGNVWEWCQDRVSQAFEQGKGRMSKDPYLIHDQDRRVARGGSYIYPTYQLTSTLVFKFAPSRGDANYGFRVARTLTAE